MIGISIVVAIALMVGTFTVLFALLDPFVGDFVQDGTGDDPAPTRDVAQFAATIPPASDAAAPTATVPVTVQPTAVPPSAVATPPPEDAFVADYRVSSQSRINFRRGPGVQFPVVTTVAPGTEVQFLDESQATQNPAADLLSPGRQWLKFRLEDGQEGWIRDVDVAPLSP